MEETKNAIQKISSSISETPAMDHALNSVLAALNLIPIVGGAFATLIGAYIPEQRKRRLLDFITQLGLDLDLFKDQINQEYVSTDQFAFLFERSLHGALDNYQKGND